MADDDLRQFMQEITTRFTRTMQAMERRLDANTAAVHDMRGEIRAQTQAILHVLDQLRGSDGPAPA